MNSIIHLEIPAEDIERAKIFYSELFDWDWQYNKEMDYHLFAIKNEEGKILSGGGMIKKETDKQGLTNYIKVEDIDYTSEKIMELGGKILVPKTAIPGMGWMVHFLDTENNLLAVWQNDTEAK